MCMYENGTTNTDWAREKAKWRGSSRSVLTIVLPLPPLLSLS